MAAPEGWRVVELGEVLESIDAGWSPQCEGRPAREREWGVLKVSAVSGGTYRPSENKALPPTLEPRPACEVRPGDLLLARASGVLDLVGRTVFVGDTPAQLMLSDKLMRLRPKRGTAGLFLHYSLESQPARDQVLALCGGSHMRNLSQTALQHVRLAVPPLPEQRKIAAILSSVDETIEKAEAVIAQLQVVKKAMMQELLTRGMPGRHTRFKQTEVGEIPEGWEVVALGDVLASIDSGWSPQCEGRAAAEGEWGVLKVSAVTWGTFDPSANKALPKHLDPRPELAVRTGDLLVSRANTPDLVGRAVIVDNTPAKLMMSDKLLRLRVGPQASPRYLNFVLASERARAFIADCATGSSRSMKNVSQGKLREMALPLPSLEEQGAVVASLTAVEARLHREVEALSLLGKAKVSLSSALLSGDLRVVP